MGFRFKVGITKVKGKRVIPYPISSRLGVPWSEKTRGEKIGVIVSIIFVAIFIAAVVASTIWFKNELKEHPTTSSSNSNFNSYVEYFKMIL